MLRHTVSCYDILCCAMPLFATVYHHWLCYAYYVGIAAAAFRVFRHKGSGVSRSGEPGETVRVFRHKGSGVSRFGEPGETVVAAVGLTKGCVHARVDMSQAQLNIQSTDRLLNQMVNLSFEYVLFRIHACLDSKSTLFRNIFISYTYFCCKL